MAGNGENISKEVKIFKDMRPTMIIAYGQDAVISRLSIDCMSRGLISPALLDINSEPDSQAARTVNFVMLLFQNTITAERDGRLIDATNIIKKFAKILRDVDSYYDNIASKIDSFEKSADIGANVLLIADTINSGITRISASALACGLITSQEHENIADALGKRAEMRTITLLNALERHFELQPQDLKDKFIPIIAKDDPSNISARFLERLSKADDVEKGLVKKDDPKKDTGTQ